MKLSADVKEDIRRMLHANADQVFEMLIPEYEKAFSTVPDNLNDEQVQQLIKKTNESIKYNLDASVRMMAEQLQKEQDDGRS